MKKKILLAIFMVLAICSLASFSTVFAADKNVKEWSSICSKLDDEAKKAVGCAEDGELQSEISDIYGVVAGVVGVICVVVIIVGGIFISTASGDSSKVTKGKNAILYGLIGLVVSVLSWAIIKFVISSL